MFDRGEPVGCELGDGVERVATGHAHLDGADVFEIA